MTRRKTTMDYIEELFLSKSKEKSALGDELKARYTKWTETLDLKDFLGFQKIIQENKSQIGVAQYFGKFRAYAFEEYVHHLVQTEVQISKPLQLFWGEKCLVWKGGGEDYAMEFDVSIGRRTNRFIAPLVVLDTKVELDAARLKAGLASFAILKRWNRRVKCFLVYMNREIDSALLELAGYWIDGIFQFSLEDDETAVFLKQMAKHLSQS